MALAETAKLIASLELKDKFTPTANKALLSVGKLETSFGKLGRTAQRGLGNAATNLAKIGVVAVAGLGVAVKGGLESLKELESATTAVGAAIEQMGLSGKVTAQQVATWANEIEASVGAAFDDKAITAAATTLLRFGKVTAANLRPALVVMTDLATKTGDVDSAASLLAKALADPEKAAGKLARSGVVLTKVQQDQIKAMVKAGKTAEAQAFLLEQLTTATKGAALASQGPYARALSTLRDVTEDAQRALAEGFLPVLERLADMLKKGLADPKNIADIRSLGRSLAGAFDQAVTAAQKIPWDSIRDAMKLAGQGAKAALDLFTSLPPWVQTAVLTGWGLNKLTGGALSSIIGQLASGVIKGVLGINAGVVNINAASVTGAGGVPVAGAAGGGVKGILAGALKIALPLVAFEAVKLFKESQDEGLNAQSAGIVANTKAMIANGATQDALASALSATNDGIKFFNAGPLTDLLYGQQITDLKAAADLLEEAITRERARAGSPIAQFGGPHAPVPVKGTVTVDGLAAGVSAGLVHSGLFKQAATIREAAGATRSGDLLRQFIRAGNLGPDAQTLAQAVALGLRNNVLLVENPTKDAADLHSAQRNLDSIRTLQSRLLANGDKNGAAALQPSIDDLEAAVNRTTEAVKLIKLKQTFTQIIKIAQSGASLTLPSGFSGGGTIPVAAHAEGGVFRTPTIALIGEVGPEAVVPLKGNPVENLASVLRVPRMANGGVAGAVSRFMHARREPDQLSGPATATATGGIFRQPTLRLIGDDGPEAVVPLKGNPFESLAAMLKVPRMADGGMAGISSADVAAWRRLGLTRYEDRSFAERFGRRGDSPVMPRLSLTVQTSISARQNDHGTKVQRRWGPTPTTAGAR